MSTSTAPTPRTRLSRGALAGALAGLVLIVLAGAYVAGYLRTGDTLPPKTSIAGVAVGGLDRHQAATKLAAELATSSKAPIRLTAGDKVVTKAPAAFGLDVDYNASVAQAGGRRSLNPVVIWQTLTGGAAHDAVVTRDDAALDKAVGELARAVDTEPVDAALAFRGTTPTLKQAVVGRTVDRAKTADAVATAYLSAATVPASVTEREADVTTAEATSTLTRFAQPAVSGPVTLTVNGKAVTVTPAMIAPALTFVPTDGALTARLDGAKLSANVAPALAGAGMKQPKDARIVLAGGKPTVIPSVDGLGVADDQLASVVRPLLEKTSGRQGKVTAATREADFTTAEAKALGVKQITGEFTTRYPASRYRVNNIGKSARLINNTLVKPGETFSMNEVLGPRTIARGWMAGGAIDGGKVVQRMGGGISQTTTTTFNAIFFAGLEDVYHKPHSLYFNRYPMGREATLDYYSVDMKFRNDSKYGVLMQAFTNNPRVGGRGTVTVRVWSTKVYDVKASQPVRSAFRSPGGVVRDNSPVCSPQSAMSGFTVRYNRRFYQGGKLVRTEPFTWTYNSLTPRVCTNPNARPDRRVA